MLEDEAEQTARYDALASRGTVAGERLHDRAVGLAKRMLHENQWPANTDDYSAYEALVILVWLKHREISEQNCLIKDLVRAAENAQEELQGLMHWQDHAAKLEAEIKAQKASYEALQAVDASSRREVADLQRQIEELRNSKRRLREALERCKEQR